MCTCCIHKCNLIHSQSALPARLEPGPDVLSLTALLADFQLDPSPILVKFPGFFKASCELVEWLW